MKWCLRSTEVTGRNKRVKKVASRGISYHPHPSGVDMLRTRRIYQIFLKFGSGMNMRAQTGAIEKAA